MSTRYFDVCFFVFFGAFICFLNLSMRSCAAAICAASPDACARLSSFSSRSSWACCCLAASTGNVSLALLLFVWAANEAVASGPHARHVTASAPISRFIWASSVRRRTSRGATTRRRLGCGTPIRGDGLQCERQHFVDGRDEVDGQILAQLGRQVFVDVLRVLLRQNHFFDPDAPCREHFFFDAADRQHAAR